MTNSAVIRPEVIADHDAVRRIITAAFEQEEEAKLVDALRESVDPLISLVAELNGRIVGHIMFSPVTIESDQAPSWTAMGLAPMAVAPDCQRQGIGSALVQAGLDACRAINEPIVFVLGHPEYYPRFGFIPAPPLGLLCEYPVPDEVFMVAELESGALILDSGDSGYSGGASRTGLIKYAPPFAKL